MTEVAGKRRRRRQPISSRRDELLDLAAEVTCAKGLEACTFRALAEQATTSTRVFTYEFGSRVELQKAMFTRAWEVIWAERGLDERDEEERRDPLGKLLAAHLRSIQTDPDLDPHQRLYDEIVFSAQRDPDLAETMAELDERIKERYTRLIEAAEEAGQADPGLAPDEVVCLLWGLGDGINMSRYNYPGEFPLERLGPMFEQAFHRIMNTCDGWKPA